MAFLEGKRRIRPWFEMTPRRRSSAPTLEIDRIIDVLKEHNLYGEFEEKIAALDMETIEGVLKQHELYEELKVDVETMKVFVSSIPGVTGKPGRIKKDGKTISLMREEQATTLQMIEENANNGESFRSELKNALKGISVDEN